MGVVTAGCLLAGCSSSAATEQSLGMSSLAAARTSGEADSQMNARGSANIAKPIGASTAGSANGAAASDANGAPSGSASSAGPAAANGSAARAGAAGGGAAGGGAAGSGMAGGGLVTQAGMTASGAPGDPAAAGGAAGSAAPTLPKVMSVDEAGGFETMQNPASGPSGRSGLFYPRELGKDGLKHPIFLWGCGGGAQPSTYAAQLTRIASHGFVVVAEVSMIGDNGDVLRASLDWIIGENARADSPFRDKLDTSKIAAGGHSIGSVNTFMMADDPRLTTTIHVAGGSLDNVNDINAPTTGMGGMRLIHPVAYICSQMDMFGNVEKTEADYTKTTVPVFFTVMTGVDHVAAASEGLPAIVAWLRWHLGGETERRAMFLDPGGEFSTGKYVSRTKNW
jgi:hypothetical protein